MIYMWQEGSRKRRNNEKPYFWFQTSNQAAAAKMKRREKFKLVGYGYKCPLWIFQAQFDRPDIAREVLRTLAGNKIEYISAEDVFVARVTETPSQPKKSPQS